MHSAALAASRALCSRGPKTFEPFDAAFDFSANRVLDQIPGSTLGCCGGRPDCGNEIANRSGQYIVGLDVFSAALTAPQRTAYSMVSEVFQAIMPIKRFKREFTSDHAPPED